MRDIIELMEDRERRFNGGTTMRPQQSRDEHTLSLAHEIGRIACNAVDAGTGVRRSSNDVR